MATRESTRTPIEAWSQPTLWGHASRVPGRGWRGGAFPAHLDPPSGEAVGAQAGMDVPSCLLGLRRFRQSLRHKHLAFLPVRDGFQVAPNSAPDKRCASLRGSPSAVPVAIGLVGRVLGRVTVFSRYSADVGLSIGNWGAY